MSDPIIHRSWGILHTDETLPEVIRLSFGGVSTRPFPIDLVFNGRHGDESRDYTSPSPGLHWKSQCG